VNSQLLADLNERLLFGLSTQVRLMLSKHMEKRMTAQKDSNSIP